MTIEIILDFLFALYLCFIFNMKIKTIAAHHQRAKTWQHSRLLTSSLHNSYYYHVTMPKSTLLSLIINFWIRRTLMKCWMGNKRKPVATEQKEPYNEQTRNCFSRMIGILTALEIPSFRVTSTTFLFWLHSDPVSVSAF